MWTFVKPYDFISIPTIQHYRVVWYFYVFVSKSGADCQRLEYDNIYEILIASDLELLVELMASWFVWIFGYTGMQWVL